MDVKIKLENGCENFCPKKAHPDDAGYDLYSWGIYNQIRTHSPFCKLLIINHSQMTHKLQMVIHSFSELHSPRQW